MTENKTSISNDPSSAANGWNPGHVVEMRNSPRSSLLIRSAKLICQSGEYPCVVRDVSEGGCKLRHFEEIPPETFVLLELANGDTYAMQRVWSRDPESGYRFVAPVNVDAFIEEASDHPRRPIRLCIKHPAVVWCDGQRIDARLQNYSQGGACIETTLELPLRNTVRLAIAGVPDAYARICWRRGLMHGLVFDRSLQMGELARIAIDLQPFLSADELDQIPQMFSAAESLRRRASA